MARVPHADGGRPVEVALIAQLGVGAGDQLIEQAGNRQRHHEGFVDALDEPSVRLGAMSLAHGDASSLYSFVVGPEGHPFHRHAGDRTFTAVSGSGGTRLRFSTASLQQIEADPDAFVRALRHVAIPPDCMFTVRFGGGIWHRFEPLRSGVGHPAMFALSCHPNELGGDLDPGVHRLVASNGADLPTLTDVLPAACAARLVSVRPDDVPTVTLALHDAPDSLQARVCGFARDLAGRWRVRLARRNTNGFQSSATAWPRSVPLPADSLLSTALTGAPTHTDCVAVAIPAEMAGALDDDALLAVILAGFLDSRPSAIGWMMAVRNRLVAPWKLRTSPIGCPVSSLLGATDRELFAGRFPVHAQRSTGTGCEVLLGADDRHLRFRSVVGVRRAHDGSATAWLATRVMTLNAFGRLYLAAIDATHRRYIAPRLLQAAIDAASRR